MINAQPLEEFEAEYSAIVDALEQWRKLTPPAESEGARGIARWFDEFHKIALTITSLPDPGRLTAFAEELDRTLADMDEKVRAKTDEITDPEDGELLETQDTFLVKVTKDGGVAGDDATDCSWTYTAKDLYGNTLGTTVAPKRARYSHVAYTYAPNDSYGLAGYDGTTLLLLVCFGEIENTDVCP